MSKNEELNRSTSRETDNKWDAREIIDVFNDRLYFVVTI